MSKRVVSLIPSSTEIVAALGCGDQLVGRSHECDYPPSVKKLPVCTEPKMSTVGSSSEIDRSITTLLANALSVYRVFPDVLQRVRPDVIVTQTQCEVCAVNLKDVEEAIGQLANSDPEIVSLQPLDLDHVWNDIERVAKVLDARQEGERLVHELRARMANIASHNFPTKPTVACIEWIEPLMAAGNWIPTLVELAGGVDLFGQAGLHSPKIHWDEMRQADPDIIMLLPCGFDIPRTMRDMSILQDQPDWSSMNAVRNGRVFVTDGQQYFNRPGPRLVESLQILAEIFHPDRFHFGHEGSGWRRF